MAKLFGKVISVSETGVGDYVFVNYAGGTTIFLEDATPFDEDGGTGFIDDGTNSETFTYTAVDNDLDTLTISGALGSSYSAGETSVIVYPRITKRYANVRVHGAEDDTIVALIPSQIGQFLTLGTRGDDEQERVTLEWEVETGNWLVADLFTDDLTDTEVSLSLYQLDDVISTLDTGAVDGEVLTWDDTNGQWISSTPSSSGGDIAESYFLGG